jgi:regulator of PEP synthase PpsR (kinase-PPPase family)
MKNEDKIVELLAESLRKQDLQAELLQSQGQKLDMVIEVIKDLSSAVKHNINSVESMLSKFDQINDHEKRISALEKKTKS